jgi:outer membrane protein assembly factor BamA
VATAFFSACSVKKYLNEDQSFLVKNKVEIEKPFTKEIERNITKYYRLKPNRRFLLFLNSRPYFYFMGSRGKDNWWKRFERNSLGEPPALVDSLYLQATTQSFKNYLRNMGYYYSDITYSVKVNKRKKATVTYDVKLNKRYFFGEYDLQISDKDIYDLVSKNMKESFIRTGYGFKTEMLLKEQDRLVTLLHNNGYFAISKDFVDFDADTSSPDGFVKLGLSISNKEDTITHKKYYIKEVTVDVDKSILSNQSSLSGNELKPDTITIDSIHYNMGQYKLNPNVLGRNIQFEPGEVYAQQKFNRTYSRLSDLSIFRFINIQTRTSETKDSGFVNYNIKLIPAVKYAFTLEPQAITSDQNNTITNQNSRNYGVAMLAQYTNRNIFRNAEIFQLSFRSSFEAQGSRNTSGFFNATEQSITASIIMPRILLFPSFDRSTIFQNTRTIISTSAIYEVNVNYRRTVFTSGLNYQFNKKLVSFNFAPAEISFIRSEIIDQTLAEQSEKDIFLQNLFSNNLILNSRIGLVYSNKPIAKGLSFIYLKWDALEIAGNLLTAINAALGTPKSDDGTYKIAGVKYFQYAKTAIDFRYNTIYDENNATVFRLFTGVAIPYGNTPEFVPFERRFFTGGVNSLRAWRPRSIGPGSFAQKDQLDFSGEIKLEANAEFRFNLYNKWLEGAVFTDAGNVWAVKDDLKSPGANFRFKDFYKSVAWDAGVGLRLNLSIFIIRFDFAVPLHDPTFVESERWVIKKIDSNWLLNNTNFNFGIGYPF